MLRSYGTSLITLIVALSTTPVLSQGAANFDTLTLSPGFPPKAGIVTGQTGGSYSLPSIANKDSKGNHCLGYGDSTPDHIMVLEQNFPKLTVQVNSGNNDTTLVIRGPNQQTIRCGDDTGSSKDASVQDTNLPIGRYEIWVGSSQPNQTWNYRLTVRE